jgi:hypothetical protein
MLTSRDQVIVKNLGEKDWRPRLDGHQYGVPAGAAVHLPFDLVAKDLGDPRAGPVERLSIIEGERVRLPSREMELERLCVLYGIHSRRMQDPDGTPVVELLKRMAPNMEVTTVTGELVPTVVSDPEGESPMAVPVDLDSPEAVRARMDQMQKELDILVRTNEAHQRAPVDRNEDVPEDGPSSSKAPRRATATA